MVKNIKEVTAWAVTFFADFKWNIESINQNKWKQMKNKQKWKFNYINKRYSVNMDRYGIIKNSSILEYIGGRDPNVR